MAHESESSDSVMDTIERGISPTPAVSESTTDTSDGGIRLTPGISDSVTDMVEEKKSSTPVSDSDDMIEGGTRLTPGIPGSDGTMEGEMSSIPAVSDSDGTMEKELSSTLAVFDRVIDMVEGKISATPAISDNATHLKEPTRSERLKQLVNQEIPGADANLLKNPIHPIFEKRNWQDSAQDIWPQLQPALRLASRFIDEGEVLAFWYHLVWGRHLKQDASHQFRFPLEGFSVEGPPLTPEQKQRTSRWLNMFGRKQNIAFLDFRAGVGFGYTTRTMANNAISVELDWVFLELLRDHGSGKKILSETQLLRANFLIAVVLLHELAHAVNLYLRDSIYEPYYDNHAVAELGHAWECWTFGGAITCNGALTEYESKSDWVTGFSVSTPPMSWHRGPSPKTWHANLRPPPVLGVLPKAVTFWVLANEFIQRVQTEEFWQIDIEERGTRELYVPPTIINNYSILRPNANYVASVRMSRGLENEVHFEESYIQIHGDN